MTTEDAIARLQAIGDEAKQQAEMIPSPWLDAELQADAEAIRVVLARLRDAENERSTAIDVSRTYIHHAEQVLGKALGFPWHKDDQTTFPGSTEDDGVCTGCHTVVSLARVAVDRLRELEADRRECQGILDRIDNQVGETLERIGRFPGPPAGFLDRLDVLCRLVSEQADRLHELERERDRLIVRWPENDYYDKVFPVRSPGHGGIIWRRRNADKPDGFGVYPSKAAAVRAAAGLDTPATEGE